SPLALQSRAVGRVSVRCRHRKAGLVDEDGTAKPWGKRRQSEVARRGRVPSRRLPAAPKHSRERVRPAFAGLGRPRLPVAIRRSPRLASEGTQREYLREYLMK